MELKTDYKDAMFDGQRRYRLIPNEDGTYSLPIETTYTQKGDKFGANDINATNKAVNQINHVAEGHLNCYGLDRERSSLHTNNCSFRSNSRYGSYGVGVPGRRSRRGSPEVLQ